MALFDPALLAAFATVVSPPSPDCVKRMAVLARLRERRDDGTLHALAETRVEQSFNEQLFAAVFDYRTLLQNGGARYHLQPKEYSAVTRQYDDFSLGFFGPGRAGARRVSAELKALTVDLDAPQPGRTDAASPVAQAHSAVAGEHTVRWVLVSNYDEMRVYRAGDVAAYERVVLTEIDTVDDFRRAYALLGLRALLGEDEESPGPLDQLWDERERAMLIPLRGHVRLQHEATVDETKLQEFQQAVVPLHGLDDALQETLRDAFCAGGNVAANCAWPLRTGIYGMKLEAGKLRQLDTDDSGRQSMIEASPAGTLRVLEHVGYQGANGPVLDERDIAERMAAFVWFAGTTLRRGCATNAIRFRWMLRDANGAVVQLQMDWVAGGREVLACSVDTTASPWILVDTSKRALEKVETDLRKAFRELLFPFECLTSNGHVVRLPSELVWFGDTVTPSLRKAVGIGLVEEAP